MTPEEKCDACNGGGWYIEDDGTKRDCPICTPSKEELRIAELEKQLSEAKDEIADLESEVRMLPTFEKVVTQRNKLKEQLSEAVDMNKRLASGILKVRNV